MTKLKLYAPGLLVAGLLIAGVLAGIVYLQEQRNQAIAGWSEQGAR